MGEGHCGGRKCRRVCLCRGDVLAAAPVRWADADAFDALLELFVIEKAAYEIVYEATNRPTWLDVPLRGLLAIAQGGAGQAWERSV